VPCEPLPEMRAIRWNVSNCSRTYEPPHLGRPRLNTSSTGADGIREAPIAVWLSPERVAVGSGWMADGRAKAEPRTVL
jgi:hypothetical protein